MIPDSAKDYPLWDKKTIEVTTAIKPSEIIYVEGPCWHDSTRALVVVKSTAGEFTGHVYMAALPVLGW